MSYAFVRTLYAPVRTWLTPRSYDLTAGPIRQKKFRKSFALSLCRVPLTTARISRTRFVRSVVFRNHICNSFFASLRFQTIETLRSCRLSIATKRFFRDLLLRVVIFFCTVFRPLKSVCTDNRKKPGHTYFLYTPVRTASLTGSPCIIITSVITAHQNAALRTRMAARYECKMK